MAKWNAPLDFISYAFVCHVKLSKWGEGAIFTIPTWRLPNVWPCRRLRTREPPFQASRAPQTSCSIQLLVCYSDRTEQTALSVSLCFLSRVSRAAPYFRLDQVWRNARKILLPKLGRVFEWLESVSVHRSGRNECDHSVKIEGLKFDSGAEFHRGKVWIVQNV